jgi:hypothetical protein
VQSEHIDPMFDIFLLVGIPEEEDLVRAFQFYPILLLLL